MSDGRVKAWVRGVARWVRGGLTERKIGTALTFVVAVALMTVGNARESAPLVVVGLVVAVSDVVIYGVLDVMDIKRRQKR